MIVPFRFEEIEVKYTYHSNENISSTNLLIAPSAFDTIQVKCRYHSNGIISGGNLLVVYFGLEEI